MRRVAAKFASCLLTNAQKRTVSVSQELFDRMLIKTLLKNVITGDETWVHGYDVETKVQSSQWMGKFSPRPKKSTSESLKCEVDVDSFFLLEGYRSL